MEKALKIGKISATGSFQLFLGAMTSTVIKAVGTILLVRLMSPEQYGLFYIALIPSFMIGEFRDWGVGPAITKYTAHYRAANKHERIHEIIVAGFAFSVATGLCLSLLSLFLANFIASTIFQRPGSSLLISIASLAILSGALLTPSRSSFVGFERMELNTLTMILESMVKSILAPLLVYIGYGALGAVIGHTLSFLVAGIIGMVLLYFIFLKDNSPQQGDKVNKLGIRKTLKMMLDYGIPLSAATIITAFLAHFYGFLMALYCSDLMIGNYQAATNFALILSFFTFPISNVLLPAFAKIDPESEHELIANVFATSVKYSSLLLVPATMAMMALSEPLVFTLFGEEWIHAPFLLTLYVTIELFVIFGFPLSMAGFLAGIGETRIMMKTGLLSLMVGLPLGFLLISSLGVVGAILGGLLAVLPKLIVGFYWIWKHYRITVNWRSSTCILVASTIAASTTFSCLTLLNLAAWIELIIGGTLFLVVYIVVAPLIAAINQNDITNLKSLISGLGFISKFINLLLGMMEKILGFHKSRKPSEDK